MRQTCADGGLSFRLKRGCVVTDWYDRVANYAVYFLTIIKASSSGRDGNVEWRAVGVGWRCLDGCGDHSGGPCTR